MATLNEQNAELIVWCFIREKYEDTAAENQIPNALKHLIKLFSQMIICSNILTSKDESDFMQKISTKLPDIFEKEFKLLYRASENQYSVSKFHKLCNGHSPTLTIIHNDWGNVFGGYTTVPWTSNYTLSSDNNAFLFVIRSNDKKMECPKLIDVIPDSRHAVFHGPKHGASFGAGCAIGIGDKCNELDTCYSYDRQTDKDYRYRGNEICGSRVKKGNRYYFQILEYEVFEIQ